MAQNSMQMKERLQRRGLGLGPSSDERLAAALAEGHADLSAILKPRYFDGIPMEQRCAWSEPDQTSLRILCAAGSDVDAVAAALGRTPKNVANKARELKLPLNDAWCAATGYVRTGRTRKVKKKVGRREQLFYPYIVKPRDEHAEILEVNELVNKHFPPDKRADICQDIFVALYSKETTIEEIRDLGIRVFVKQYYRENHEKSGFALSISASRPDRRDWDDILDENMDIGQMYSSADYDEADEDTSVSGLREGLAAWATKHVPEAREAVERFRPIEGMIAERAEKQRFNVYIKSRRPRQDDGYALRRDPEYLEREERPDDEHDAFQRSPEAVAMQRFYYVRSGSIRDNAQDPLRRKRR